MPNLGQEISSINFGSIIGGSLNAIVEAQCQSANTTVDFIRNVGFYPGANGGLGKPIYVSFLYDKETSPYQPAGEPTYSIQVVKGGSGYSSDATITAFTPDNKEVPCTFSLDVGGAITAVTLTGLPTVTVDTALTVKSEVGKDASLKLICTPGAPAKKAQVEKMQLEVPVLTMVPIPFIKIAEATIDFNVKINSVTTSQSKEDSSYGGSLEVNTSFSFWRFKMSAKLNATLSNQKSSSNSEEVKRDYSLNIHIKAVQEDMPEGASRLLDILQDSISSRPAQSA